MTFLKNCPGFVRGKRLGPLASQTGIRWTETTACCWIGSGKTPFIWRTGWPESAGAFRRVNFIAGC
ncbi:tail fiber protein [Staphylospora marina]|uniref:tail fiber protein n=1 Tax=Staphylospora marina TaxID=2490858 RepID=UPI003B96994C